MCIPGKVNSVVNKIRRAAPKTVTTGGHFLAYPRWLWLEEVTGEAKEVVLHQMLDSFIVEAVDFHIGHVLDVRFVTARSLPHLVEELRAFLSAAASVQHTPVGVHLLCALLACFSGIVLAKHARY